MCQKTKLVGFFSSYVDADANPKRIIDDMPCDAVMLSVWNKEDDGNDTNKPQDGNNLYQESSEEIYWGFLNPVHQLFPMETTALIPVSNAKDIFVRCNKNKSGVARVSFSCFQIITIEEEKK